MRFDRRSITHAVRYSKHKTCFAHNSQRPLMTASHRMVVSSLRCVIDRFVIDRCIVLLTWNRGRNQELVSHRCWTFPDSGPTFPTDDALRIGQAVTSKIAAPVGDLQDYRWM